MVVIASEVFKFGARMPRTSINGHQFIEAEILTTGGRLRDPRIGSQRDVHNVKTWTPADNSEDNEIAGPVTLNFEALNSEPLEVDLATGSAFEDLGTHDGTKGLSTGIILDTASPAVDFEDYNVDTNLTDVSQPDEWINRAVDAGSAIRDDVSGESENQYVENRAWGKEIFTSLEEVSDLSEGIIRCRFRFVNDQGKFLVFATVTGSGTALRGHGILISRGSVWVSFMRLNHSQYWYGLQSWNLGFTPVRDVWYWIEMRFRVDTTVSMWWKVWTEGETEPGAYQWGHSDAVYIQPGAVGIATDIMDGNRVLWDNFSIEPIPPLYLSSGVWTSDPLPVSAALTLASSRINFTVDTPTDTSAALKCRWGIGDSWLTCTPGQKLPGASYRDLMLAGAAKSLLELRIELATTGADTPTIDNLIVDFDPCNFDDVALEVDGQVATIANGHLSSWGRHQVDAGVEVEDFDDLTAQAWGFENYKLDAEALTANFKYDGYTVATINFSQLLQAFKVGGADAYFAFRAGVLEAITRVSWTVWERWYQAGHNYEWTLIDRTQGIHADAWWWCGHPRIDDFPGSILAGIPELNDFPGSLLARAWKRDDFPGSSLVQGWRIDDFPGSLLAAIRTAADFPGAVIVGIERHDDFPGSLLVYGVNRNNVIEIHTVDADTVAALEAAGFVFPPEAS
jgi:hypothetical protein